MDSNKSGSLELTSLKCVQSCIKAKHGLGQHIPIHFRMELDIDEETQITSQSQGIKMNELQLKYDFRTIGQQYLQSLEGQLEAEKEAKVNKWLIENAVEDYCLKQVLKMC